VTDRQTDGQTDGRTDRQYYDSQDRASITASSGKNVKNVFYIYDIGSITARHSSSGRQPNFAA